MTAEGLNVIGLVLGMAGVAIIFFWGPPMPSFEEGSYLLLSGDANDEEEVKAVRRKKRRHIVLSRLGLVMIFVGFAMQLASLLAF